MASLLKLISNGVLSTGSRNLNLPNLCVSNNSAVCYSKLARISQKLGISEPPKKPMTGFLRFIQENQSSLKQSSQSQTEMFANAGAQWRQMSNEHKEKYNAEYKKEFAEYTKAYEVYLKKLTPDQKLAIKAERKEKREKQVQAAEKKSHKDEERSLGKPKKPSSAYLLFAVAKAQSTNKKPSDLKDEWDRLSDEQKQVYKQKYLQLYDTYEDALKKWEDKMMADGKAHLVRKSRILTKSNDKKPRKKSKTE